MKSKHVSAKQKQYLRNQQELNVIKKYNELNEIDRSTLTQIRRNELEETLSDIRNRYMDILPLGD